MPLSVLTFAVMMAAYHGAGLVFELCDRRGWLASAKVRKRDRLTYLQLLPRVLANQVLILLPAMVAAQLLGLAFVGPAHLAWWRFLINLPLLALGHDVVQYLSHRFVLHRPGLMRPLGHAVHHSTGAAKAVSACYMSGADFFLEITLPYLAPLILVGGGGADVTFQCLVAALGALGGLYEHSGYDFAALPAFVRWRARAPRLGAAVTALITSKAHGEHHRRADVSFSDGFDSPGLCDTLLRTRWDMAA